MSTSPIRVAMRPEEAAVVMAALLYYEDTFLDPEADQNAEAEVEARHWTYLAGQIRIRLHRALRRRGYAVLSEES